CRASSRESPPRRRLSTTPRFLDPVRLTSYVAMVTSRRSFLVALAALLGPRAANAQLPGKAPRVGILCPHRLAGSRGMPRDVFEHALAERGWTPGSNVVLEYRDTDREHDVLAGAAAELSRLNVDVILTCGGQATRAAQHSTTAIPIVMAATG